MIIRAFAISNVRSSDDFTMPGIDPNDVEVVFTLGNIPPDALDYILLMARRVPLLGVLGGLDPEEIPGLEDHHGEVVELGGVRFGLLNGAPRYEKHPNQFTEREMSKVVRKMPPADIVLSHAPPLSTSMNEPPLHRGFEAFDVYIQRHRPRYWIHGHPDRSYTAEAGGTGTQVIGVQTMQLLRLSLGEVQPATELPSSHPS
jgi:Icc-related predicted phosphoesterase